MVRLDHCLSPGCCSLICTRCVVPPPWIGSPATLLLPCCAGLRQGDQAILPHAVQSYRKAVTAARKDKKPDKRQGLTEEQKQEIRSAQRELTSSPSPPRPRREYALRRGALR